MKNKIEIDNNIFFIIAAMSIFIFNILPYFLLSYVDMPNFMMVMEGQFKIPKEYLIANITIFSILIVLSSVIRSRSRFCFNPLFLRAAVIVTVLIWFYFMYSFIGKDRTYIKLNWTILNTVLLVLMETLGSLLFLIRSSKMKTISILVLVSAAFVIKEREILLFFIIPATIYLKSNFSWLMWMFITSLLVIFLLGMKFIMLESFMFDLNYLKRFILYVAKGLISDTGYGVVIAIDFYRNATSEMYSGFNSIPFHLREVLGYDGRTNGQISTLYYTQGRTGTGFNFFIEMLVVFGGMTGIILYNLFYLALGYAVVFFRSAIFFTPLAVFVVKLPRSDFYPIIFNLLLPSIVTMVAFYLILKLIEVLLENVR